MIMIVIVTLFIFLSSGIYATSDTLQGQNLVVKISDGKVQGKYQEAPNGNKYVEFSGIPFAKPPVGKLRFQDPIPVKPWEGIIKSRKPNTCMQHIMMGNFDPSKVAGDEDCLYVNVFTPTLDPNANLNVIVNIHGGGFTGGSSNYITPLFLMTRQDFVLVTLHYRVGILGFFSTEDSAAPGNYGMKDQVLALKWVQKNIHHFGGNSKAVTIYGCSAGGASVHYHMISPLSTGLFQNAISASGSVLNPWVLSENNLRKARKLADNVGCDFKDTEMMVRCLRQRPAKEIIEQIGDFLQYNTIPLAPFSISVDASSPRPFLPETPKKLLTSGKVKDLPWLISSMAYEGLYPAVEFLVPEFNEKLNTNWDEMAANLLDINDTVPIELHKKVTDEVRKFYLQDKKITVPDTFTNLIEMISDRWYLVGIEESVRLQTKANKSPVYVYKFNYRGKLSIHDMFQLTIPYKFGAAHGDDQFYIFPPVPGTYPITDEKMINLMLGIVTSFAKTGRPSVEGVNWESACTEISNEISYLNINSVDDISVKKSASLSNLEFWKTLPINE